MSDFVPATPISPLRRRLIDDMNMRRFSRETQRNYIRDVGRFATFLGRAPNTATTLEPLQADVPGVLFASSLFYTNRFGRPRRIGA